ncbi:LysM peptidoglycan-binding domain-containing protein [Paenibacillus rigui]|uniref:LysM domain-containing protein n=1 Tax=Paenibacillus rigui TaxID=554312 RepID=A0A229UU08_9BACL|nr:LysM peptidoglycan-binding domain-containing protein [Paenibacillus rigui]OXM86833.1 hypothetical protein CF651_08260 [Paenibacillus rigui]
MKIHMVKKGDTLYQIAQKYNVDLDALIALNTQIADPNVIDVGMKVKIPTNPKPVEPPSDYLYKHIVMQGDTLWKLGKAWNVPLNDMIEANPQLKNPSVLMTGETVYIPKVKPQSGHHPSQHQHYHGGHGHKKNTAPIQTMPAPMPVPMPTPPVNMPTEMAPAPEMPLMPMPFPNLPNVPNMEMPQQQAPNMEMPYHPGPAMELPLNQAPNMEMPYHTVPNMEMPFEHGPNMEMPIHQEPNVEMPYNQGPNMEMPFHQGPNIEMPSHQGPNVPSPYSPFTMTSPAAEVNQNQPVYVSPFSEQVPDLMPEVPSNMMPNFSAQQPSMDLFQQFQVPATEVMSHHFNDMNQAAWPQQAAPSFPTMPSAEQMPFGGYPAQMLPAYTTPMHFKDCGCGGSQMPGFNQPIPYPLGAHAEMPVMGYEPHEYPHGGHPQMMYPGQGFPGMMPAMDHPSFPGYDHPMAMTSAYPGGMYPMHHGFPMGNPYGGFPYGGHDGDCGCGGHKSRGEEQEERVSLDSVSRSSSDKEAFQSSGSNKKNRAAASNTRSSQKTSSRVAASKPKAKRSPWINV